MSWRLHWLEAEGDLGSWRERVATDVDAAREALAALLPMPTLDVLVQRRLGGGIPEYGISGRAHGSSLFSITLDPGSPHYEMSLDGGLVRRTVVHEVHHCLRMARRGYGRTLGEALVSEGLASRFVGHVLRTPPDLWDTAFDDDTLASEAPSAAELAAPNRDHAAWFFGAGGRKPRWFGYTLGFRIVGDWLATAGAVDATPGSVSLRPPFSLAHASQPGTGAT